MARVYKHIRPRSVKYRRQQMRRAGFRRGWRFSRVRRALARSKRLRRHR